MRTIVLLALIAAASSGCHSPANAPSAETSATPEPVQPPGTRPTPYTAGQIARCHPTGTFTEYRVTTPAETVDQRAEWVASDALGCEMVATQTRADGTTIGDEIRSVAEWWELRNHAALPYDRSTVSEETIEVEAGRFDCWKYVTEQDGMTTAMWFDKSSAGSPIQYVQSYGSNEVLRMELLATNRLRLQ